MGWKIDYKKLLAYLQEKYDANRIFYFGGVEIHDFKYDYQEDGTTKRKANCDVDMAFYMMKEKEKFERVIVLSGDGDFLPVLKYLKEQKKDVIILSRGPRTAREIRQFASANFRDFVRLEKYVKFEPK